MFRCRHFIKQNPRIEHYSWNERLPSNNEYFDEELSGIDRVLYIREIKNLECAITANFSPDITLEEKVRRVLESSLLQYYYTPIEIYRFQTYLKGVEYVNKQKEQLRKEFENSVIGMNGEKEEQMNEEAYDNGYNNNDDDDDERTRTEREQREKLLLEQEAVLDESLSPLIKALPVLADLPAEQRLVLVKWNNQTYDQITWELEESVKHEQNKILTYYRINRLPDTRTLISPFR